MPEGFTEYLWGVFSLCFLIVVFSVQQCNTTIKNADREKTMVVCLQHYSIEQCSALNRKDDE